MRGTGLEAKLVPGNRGQEIERTKVDRYPFVQQTTSMMCTSSFPDYNVEPLATYSLNRIKIQNILILLRPLDNMPTRPT
jgi:hypothetical protein